MLLQLPYYQNCSLSKILMSSIFPPQILKRRGLLGHCHERFWGSHFERCFINVCVFNPLVPSNSSSLLSSTFKKCENINVELMVREFVRLSMFILHLYHHDGNMGLAHEAIVFYKCLASLLSAKWGDEYSVVLGWLRCCLGFSLLRSAIQCIQDACSLIGAYTRAPPPMDLVQVEFHLSE